MNLEDIQRLEEIMHRAGNPFDAGWIEDQDIALLLHQAERQGLIRRLSVVQIEWTQKGIEILRQVDIALDVLKRKYRGRVEGMNCVITSARIHGEHGPESYGFHFERGRNR